MLIGCSDPTQSATDGRSDVPLHDGSMNDAPVEVIESDRGAPDDGNAPADITMTDVVAPIDAPTDAPDALRRDIEAALA